MGAFLHNPVIRRIIIVKQIRKQTIPKQPWVPVMSSPYAFLSMQEHPHQIISKNKYAPQQQLHIVQPSLDTQSKFLPTHSLCASRIKTKASSFKCFSLGTQLWGSKAWFSKGKIPCSSEKAQSSVVSMCQL